MHTLDLPYSENIYPQTHSDDLRPFGGDAGGYPPNANPPAASGGAPPPGGGLPGGGDGHPALARWRIGVAIRKHRKVKGWTIEELAELVGVSDRTVRYWEKRKRGPGRKNREKLAQLFGLTIEDLEQDPRQLMKELNAWEQASLPLLSEFLRRQLDPGRKDGVFERICVVANGAYTPGRRMLIADLLHTEILNSHDGTTDVQVSRRQAMRAMGEVKCTADLLGLSSPENQQYFMWLLGRYAEAIGCGDLAMLEDAHRCYFDFLRWLIIRWATPLTLAAQRR